MKYNLFSINSRLLITQLKRHFHLVSETTLFLIFDPHHKNIGLYVCYCRLSNM